MLSLRLDSAELRLKIKFRQHEGLNHKNVCMIVFKERRISMKYIVGLMVVTVIGIGFCGAALKSKLPARKHTI